MRTVRLAAFLVVAIMLAPATGLAAQAGVTVRGLAGLSPAQARAKIASVPSGWPIQPAFQVAASNGTLTFIDARTLVQDPAAAQNRAAFRTGGEGQRRDYLDCQVSLERKGVTELGGSTVLMFRNGRFEAAFDVPPSWKRPLDPRTVKPVETLLKQPRPLSPFARRHGELPLEDGLGFMRRWDRAQLAPGDVLRADCRPPPKPKPRSQSSRPRYMDAPGFLQGLANVPSALKLPAVNASRAKARKRGPALLARLKVGAPLGASPETLAKSHKGVRVYRSDDPDYAVLSIDLGGAQTRNLSDKRDAALVGVRRGRVAWISPPDTLGPGANLLCLNKQGVPAEPRVGCHGWGDFSP